MQETLVQSLGREDSPGEGNGHPFQYSCLENSMDRGAWQATVHEVAKCWTQLDDQHTLQNFLGPQQGKNSIRNYVSSAPTIKLMMSILVLIP